MRKGRVTVVIEESNRDVAYGMAIPDMLLSFLLREETYHIRLSSTTY
jgi:hypothetical protein